MRCLFVSLLTLLSGLGELAAESRPDTVHLQWECHPAALTASSIDVPTDVTLDRDGNLYVTGKSEGLDTGYDYLIIKYGNTGTLEWSARYDGPDHGNDIPMAIRVDAQGSVYLTGLSAGSYLTGVDIATVKYTPTGAMEWNRRYSSLVNCGQWGPCYNMTDAGVDLSVDQSGNVFVAGFVTLEDQQVDMLTMKYSPDGNEEWIRTYDGLFHGRDRAVSILADGSGDVYVTGLSVDSTYYDQESFADCITLKYDPWGTRLWEQRLSLGDTLSAEPVGMAVSPDGSLYVTGNVSGEYRFGVGYGEKCDIFTAKYSPAGSLDWVRIFDGTPFSDYLVPPTFHVAEGIAIDAGGNVYVTGISATTDPYPLAGDSLVTIKYSDDGSAQWVVYHDRETSELIQSAGISVDESGTITITGTLGHAEGLEFKGETVVLLQYASTSQLQREENYGAGDNTTLRAVGVSSDGAGNAFVIGQSGSIDESDFLTLKFTRSDARIGTFFSGGPGNATGFVADGKTDNQGNIYITGTATGPGMNQDYMTAKVDSLGEVVWAATYDTPDHRTDNALALEVDQWGNVYVTGLSHSFSGTLSATVKYDASGSQQWVSLLDSSSMRVILIDGGGNVYVGGSRLAKYDQEGTLKWHTADLPVVGLAIDPSENVYATGGDFLRKLNGSGVELWSVPLSSRAVAIDRFGDVYAASPFGTNWGFMKKFTSDGVELWAANVGGDKIVIYDSATVYVGGGRYAGVHKLLTDGSIVWTRTISADLKRTFDVDFEGNAYCAGTSLDGTGLHAAKFTPDGATEWSLQKDDTHLAVAIKVDNFGNVFLISEKEEMDFSRTSIIEKYSQGPPIISSGGPQTMPGSFRLDQNYPNPFNPTTTIGFSLSLSGDISLTIVNLLGEEVATLVSGPMDAGIHSVQWDAGGQPSGVYFYRLRAGDFVETRKLVLVK